MKNKIFSVGLCILCVFFVCSTVHAEIIFQDNFDGKPDWDNTTEDKWCD